MLFAFVRVAFDEYRIPFWFSKLFISMWVALGILVPSFYASAPSYVTSEN